MSNIQTKFASWEVVTLGAVCAFKGGSGFKGSFQGRDSGEHPFIKVSDLNLPGNEKHVLHSNNWVSTAELKLLKATLQPIGATVFAKVGAALKLNRRRVLVRPTVIDNNMMAAIPEETHLNREYLYYFLLGEDLGRFCQESAVPSINQGHLESIQIPLPSLAEQRKIAEILRTWDEAIETAEAELKAKQERKRWIMEKFMSRRPVQRVFGRELRIGTIEQFELAGIITLSRGKVISKNDIEGLPGTYPVYSSSIHNNGLFGRYGDYMFDEEMITWSVDGGGNFFHRPKHRFSITNVCGCMQVDTKIINCAFLASQLQYLHKRLTFDYQSKAHPSVIRKMYNLWIPSIEEQVSMADAMAICDEQMLNLNNRIKALCAQKRGLMQKLLAGDVRVAA